MSGHLEAEDSLTERIVRKAKKSELRALCRQYGLDDYGTSEQLRARLLNTGRSSEKPSETTPRQPSGEDKRPALIGIIVIVVAVLFTAAIGAAFWARPNPVSEEPPESRITWLEANYLREISSVLSLGMNSTRWYADTTEAVLSGEMRRTEALGSLGRASWNMMQILQTLEFATPPCSAYEPAHSDAIKGFGHIVQAFNHTSDGLIYTNSEVIYTNSDDLKLGLDHMNDAKVSLISAISKIAVLADTAPNCQPVA